MRDSRASGRGDVGEIEEELEERWEDDGECGRELC